MKPVKEWFSTSEQLKSSHPETTLMEARLGIAVSLPKQQITPPKAHKLRSMHFPELFDDLGRGALGH